MGKRRKKGSLGTDGRRPRKFASRLRASLEQITNGPDRRLAQEAARQLARLDRIVKSSSTNGEVTERPPVIVTPEQLKAWIKSFRDTGLRVGHATTRKTAFNSQALALREALCRDHRLTTTAELLLADLIASGAMDFQEVAHSSLSEDCSYEAQQTLLEMRRLSREHLLRLLTALRDHTTPPLSVKIEQADQVNVAHQQVNAPPPGAARVQMITEDPNGSTAP